MVDSKRRIYWGINLKKRTPQYKRRFSLKMSKKRRLY
jgi:hypothetical protein